MTSYSKAVNLTLNHVCVVFVNLSEDKHNYVFLSNETSTYAVSRLVS